jgi:hypothetical protein
MQDRLLPDFNTASRSITTEVQLRLRIDEVIPRLARRHYFRCLLSCSYSSGNFRATFISQCRPFPVLQLVGTFGRTIPSSASPLLH